MKRINKIWIGIMICLVLTISGCTYCVDKEYTQEDFIPVLETSQDYKDFKNDFKTTFEKDFTPVLKLKEKLNKTIADEKLASDDITIFKDLYTDLPDKEMYEVRMYDDENPGRGILAILDMKEKSVVKFLAHIELSGGVEYD